MFYKRRFLKVVPADVVVAPPPNIMPKYMSAGQSNSDGRIPLTERPQWMIDEGNMLPHAIMNHSDTLNWHTYNNTDFFGNTFSYDLLLFKKVLDYLRAQPGHATDEIYITKHAVGGSSLSTNWNVNGIPGDSGNFSNVLKNRYLNAAASPQAALYDLKALFWNQGESDTTGGADTAYYQNMKNLISYVRSYTGKPSLVFVLCGINTSSVDYNANVQNAKIQIASEDSNVFFAAVANGTQYLNSDMLHTNYLGGNDLATTVFNIMLANKTKFGLV